jgi:secondary thiamine-phosphate synthase enzyme
MFEISTFEIRTSKDGLIEITKEIENKLLEFEGESGHCNVFIQHTSASLIIQENADPSAKYDLEKWIKRLVPENDPNYTHTAEGLDDMPSHIKSVLTQSSITIPVIDKELILGTWQGIYLWEHRTSPHRRKITVSLVS